MVDRGISWRHDDRISVFCPVIEFDDGIIIDGAFFDGKLSLLGFKDE